MEIAPNLTHEQRLAKKEIWNDIPGYEGKYQASNLGNIRNRFRLLKNTRGRDGYVCISLHKNGNRKIYKGHRLIAITFIPNVENKPFINHKNGIKHYNIAGNLEWCTQSENVQHAVDIGLLKVSKNHHFYTNHPSKGKHGKDNPKSKPVLQYTKSGEFIKEWESIKDAQRKLLIHNISGCCTGKIKTSGGYIWRFPETL